MRHGLDVHALGYGERPHLDQLAGVGADDARADDLARRRRDDLGVTQSGALGLGPVVLVHRPAQHADAAIFATGGIFGEADMRDLGIGEGHPGYDLGVHPGRQPEQRAADDDAGVVVGHVRVLHAARHVADGKDTAVRRHKPPVHLDAALVVLDAGRFEIETGDIRRAAGGDQEIAALDEARHAVLRDLDVDQVGTAGDAVDMGAFADVDAFGRQPVDDEFGDFRILVAEHLHGFDQRDAAAEPHVCLCHLHAHGAGADDDKVIALLAALEDGLVGEIGDGGQAGDGRNGGRGPRGDNEASRLDAQVGGHDRILGDKPRLAPDHLDAETSEALDGIIGRDRIDHAVHVRMQRPEVDRGTNRIDAERAGGPHVVRTPRRCDERLRRHAARIEAIATHLALLDQGHRDAELGRRSRDAEPARARADHADVDTQIFTLRPARHGAGRDARRIVGGECRAAAHAHEGSREVAGLRHRCASIS